MWRPAVMLVLAIAMTAACGSDGPSRVDESTTVNGQTLDLSIDGASFRPSTAVSQSVAASGGAPAQLLLVAGDTGTAANALSLSVSVPSAVGTYPIGASFFTVVVLQRGPRANEVYWEAAVNSGSGSIEITSRTSNSATGRVNVSLAPAGVASSTRLLTGTFTARF